MPLNPPSYIGQDVWFSPDTYVNQVPVALWQPAKERGIPASFEGELTVYMNGGEDIQFQGGAEASNQQAALNQRLIQQGVVTPEQVAQAQGTGAPPEDAPPVSGDPTTSGRIISNDTGGIENRTGPVPPTFQLSQNFTVQQLTEFPFHARGNGINTYWVTDPWKIGERGSNGLTPWQLVANARLLAVNVLDRIKNHFPDFAVNSTIRPVQNNPTSQHCKFQACDFRRTQGGPSSLHETAIWCRDNVPFDQLLLEYAGGGGWVHISYANPPRVPASRKVGTIDLINNRSYWGQLVKLR